MADVIAEFYLNGEKVTPPSEWLDLRQVIQFGKISNQPIIETERFTFSGRAAQIIKEHYQNGNILIPLPISFVFTQGSERIDIFKGNAINLTDSPEFLDTDFGEGFSPLSVSASIIDLNSIGTLQQNLEGVTWGYLLETGQVGSGDYSTVLTAVKPLYDAKDVLLALVSIYVLKLQLEDIKDEIKRDKADLTTIVSEGNTDPLEKAAKIIYGVLLVVVKVATYAIIFAQIVSLITNIITVFVPPIVKNKGISWRRGLEIIFGSLGFGFSSSFDELDTEKFLPSKPRDLTGNIFKDLLPSFAANETGVPNPTDFGYFASDFVELAKRRFNARFDVSNGIVSMRWEEDKDLLRESNFRPQLDIKTETYRPNIGEIPNTRVISFLTDSNDEYTFQNYTGTAYEVRNQSIGLPFKGVERIDLPVALGSIKTSLSPIEKLIIELASVADKIADIVGGSPNLAGRIKSNRVNVLLVSSNNYSVPKIVPTSGRGNMLGNHRSITSAKAIENKYYYNRSIVRGNGQKYIIPDYTTVLNLRDRAELLKGGVFIDSKGNKAQVRNLEYSIASDTATGEIAVDFDYIAKGHVTEIFYEA